MTIEHKLLAIRKMVEAAFADRDSAFAERDYYKERCSRQGEILEELKIIVLNSDSISDEILSVFTKANNPPKKFDSTILIDESLEELTEQLHRMQDGDGKNQKEVS